MSHVAIAAALALEDVSAGERLAAFSLASYANRDCRAWAGTPKAAARAGLSRSQFLAARGGLQKRGLITVLESGSGRGHAPTVALGFAEAGPWVEGEINAALFEAVLGYSRAKGSARLLIATLAAVADDQLAVIERATGEICAAAGLADSTYRRARSTLLASGELVLDVAGGGRSRTNRWQLRDPSVAGLGPVDGPRGRVAPPATARPLISVTRDPPRIRDGRQDQASETAAACAVKGPGVSGVSGENPGQSRTVSAVEGPGLSGVSGLNPGQDRTLFPETPPQTPPETPPPHVRAGREPQNPRTFPPSPPAGGSRAGSIPVVEDYVSDRGRKRQRTLTVELDAIRAELALPTTTDASDWAGMRSQLKRTLGAQFEIWLAALELVATSREGVLLLDSPSPTRGWVEKRFGRLIDRTAQTAGRQIRLATRRELQLARALAAAAGSESPLPDQPFHDQQEAS